MTVKEARDKMVVLSLVLHIELKLQLTVLHCNTVNKDSPKTN